MYLLAPQTIGETARRQFLSRLAQHYPNHKIYIGRGHYRPNEGLVFEDIRIAAPSVDSFLNRSRELIRIERLTLVSDLHPEKLLDKQAPMTTKRIDLDGVQLTTWLKENGDLSIQDLMPMPMFGPTVPLMELRRTKLRLIDPTSQNRPIDVELDRISIHCHADSTDPTKRKIFLQGSADFANGLAARIDQHDGVTNVRAKVSGASLNRDLYDRLPSQWAAMLVDAKDLQCTCDAGLLVRRDAKGRFSYRIKTTVHHGQFNHPRLPQPITDLKGDFLCDPRGITIEKSQGLYAGATLGAAGRVDGLQWPCDVDLQVSARGLMLESRLAASLPPSAQTLWNKLEPHGRVDAQARLQHKNAQWDVSATVDCNAVDIRYEKFPFPVEGLVGRIQIQDGIAFSDALSGRIGDSRLQCAFRNPIRPGITNERSFAIQTYSPVTIDNSMLAGLTPRGSPTTELEKFIRSLRPRGTIQLESAVLSTSADGEQNREIVIRLVDGHVNYQKFAYPIGNITGTVEIKNDLVRLINVSARNSNAGTVTCQGSYRMQRKNPSTLSYQRSDPIGLNVESELILDFVATDVPMDQSLRNSLPESAHPAWDSVAPSGLLDQLNVSLSQHGTASPLQVFITARQHDSGQISNRTLSLRPVALPYRLDVTGGSATYDGSKVTIRSLKGRHDASTLSADGQCIKNTNGRWELALDLHSGSRLHPDAELIEAMPASLHESIRRLQLRGPVSVRGKTRILLPDESDPVPNIAWNLGLQLEGNRIGDVGPVHSLRGEIAVRGVQDQNGPRAVGQVRIDSMHVDDFQITAIEGPFSIAGDQLFLGSKSQSTSGWREAGDDQDSISTQSSIEGSMFGGKIRMDGHCVLSTGNFTVGLLVDDGRLPEALADFGHADNKLTGSFQGQAKLQGKLGNFDLLNGSGTASLNGANLYQLPLIVQFLNLLRITPTEDVAFTDGKVDFSLDGATIAFNDLQFWGDLVALQGDGTLNRMHELDLTFNTRVSPQNGFTQLFRPLQSKRYTLSTVDVRGPLHALQIERRAFDGVNQTLELLFPAMAEAHRDEPIGSKDRSRSWFR